MRFFIFSIFTFLLSNGMFAQNPIARTKVMPLGVFHFAYPNLDLVKTQEKDQISVLQEPYQSQIVAICKAIEEFKPTIISVEIDPNKQLKIDSLFLLYKSDNFVLKKDEAYQLAFRMGRNLGLTKIYCVNDWGRHYSNLDSLFNDSLRLAKFSNYIELRNADRISKSDPKVISIVDELIRLNNPERVKERLAYYLYEPFQYEEKTGDFTGVDFETGRWFNRNLRIFRNIQRIPHSSEDRILVIFGASHMNLLNLFFDVSSEFELVSPLPYLENARK